MKQSVVQSRLAKRVAILRIAFGVMWAVDAAFKWQPSFMSSFMDLVTGAAQGQPAWLNSWFTAWQHLTALNPTFFAICVALIETFIAVALLFGFAKRFTYLAAIIFSLVIWSVPEGFGGPYSAGSTDVGAGIVYAVVFFALYGLEQLATESVFSVDESIKRKLSWWYVVADPR